MQPYQPPSHPPVPDPAAATRRDWGCILAAILIPVFMALVVVAVAAYFVLTAPHSTVVDGRPFRRRRSRRASRIVVRPDTYRLPVSRGATLESRWQRAATGEWESVGSFLQLAAELEHVGAPEELVARARAAADDEVDHARRCLSLSDGTVDFASLEVVPLTPRWRARALVQLAVESLIDGCVNEGVAARELLLRAEKEPPEVRSQLLAIAADEVGHADLAWDIVVWAVAEGGAPVSRAVRYAAQGLVKRASTNVASHRLAWCIASVRHEVAERVERELDATCAA